MANKSKDSWTLKRFFSPIKWNWGFLIKPFLVSCIYAIFSITTVEIFKYATTCIQNWYLKWTIISLLVYIWVFILHLIFSRVYRNIWWVTMNYEWKKYIQREWLPKFFKLDNTHVEKLWTWKIQHIIDQWFQTWRSMFSDITSRVPKLLIIGVFAIYQIYIVAGIFAVIIFITLLIWLFITIKHFNKHAIMRRKQRTRLNADYNRHLIKMLMSKMEIVQNNKEKEEIEIADDLVSQATTINIKVWLYLWGVTWAGRVFSRLLNIFILLYWILIVKSWWDLSLFVGLIVCSTLLADEFEKFSLFYKDITDQFANVQKLRETFDEIPNMKNKHSNICFKYKKWEINIKNISFSYDWISKILDNFSLKINWWQKTAFVWESGSWKTTLIKLIAWYLAPDAWNIFVDDQNINEINIYDYFSHIWFLTQDPSVFDWTIYDNLIYALKYKPTNSQLKKAIKASECEFIYDFTEWLQTEIWERWIRLSGWQKQRLAIAKIMLKNPDIILLDEPTSALDSFNEEKISWALNNLFEWKTVIIIAHRLQTVKSADRILLFEDWKVIEDWNHQSLIRKNWRYKKMLDLQSWF